MQQQEKELGRFYLLSQRCEYLICALTHRNKHIYIYISVCLKTKRGFNDTGDPHFRGKLKLKSYNANKNSNAAAITHTNTHKNTTKFKNKKLKRLKRCCCGLPTFFFYLCVLRKDTH